eukprot:scaffold47447_cov51-Phaeocystis_antarctica.AAC.2
MCRLPCLPVSPRLSSRQSARPHPLGNHLLSNHLLEHPLPLDRELVRRAQELAHPPDHGAQLGGARGLAVGLRVPQPRGDRLGLEGVRALRPPLLARVGHQRAQLLLRLGHPPLRPPQLDQVAVEVAAPALILPPPRHRLDQQRLGLRQLALLQEHLAEVAGGPHRFQVGVPLDLAPRRQRLAEQRLRLGQLALVLQAERQAAERPQRVRGPVPTLCAPRRQPLPLERFGLREPPLVRQHTRHVVEQKRRAALRLGHRLQHRLRLADHPPAQRRHHARVDSAHPARQRAHLAEDVLAVLRLGDLGLLHVDAAQDLADPRKPCPIVAHLVLKLRHALLAEQHVQLAPLRERLCQLEDAPRARQRRRALPHPPLLRLALLRQQKEVRRRAPLDRIERLH